nr:MAG TPA: hypothetical protein [Caudoviricetes sp.]
MYKQKFCRVQGARVAFWASRILFSGYMCRLLGKTWQISPP